MSAELYISHYRGHKIEVRREECLAGYDLIYFTIIRDSDGYLCEDSFTESDETVSEVMQVMKIRINNELAEKDPWLEKALEKVV